MSETKRDGAIAKVASEVASEALNAGSIQDILKDPSAMANISQKLASAINFNLGSSTVNLPPSILRRVKALKNLQKSTTQIEADFYREVQCLEAKYHKLYQPFYDQRQTVVTGSYEPTDAECQWPEQVAEDKESPDSQLNQEGIPEFWLSAFRNCDIFADVIKECDEEVLACLSDVKVIYSDTNGLDFTIEYHFQDNEWFSNKVLTMTYYVTCDVNKDDPWSFEGATISACQGCHIDWKKGKDLTVKTVKKKSKSKGKGQTKVTTKQVPNETFFSMFSFNKSDKATSELDQDEARTQALSDNFNRAEFIRDRLVPRAVLFFTGEAIEEDDEDEVAEEFQPARSRGLIRVVGCVVILVHMILLAECAMKNMYEDDYEEDEEGEGGEDYDPKQDLNEAKPPECKQQ